MKGMKVLDSTRERVVVELSPEQLADLVAAVSTIREQYEPVVQVMLDVPEERIVELDDRLAAALKEANRLAHEPRSVRAALPG